MNFNVATPSVAGVTPSSGVAGTQVTFAGSGFGTAQGSGQVWLGSAAGTIVSWSDTQVVATVSANAQSGTAQITQGGVASNSVSFSVNTASITGITPDNGVPGTQVTISGSGFGAVQGIGNAWLGSASGTVVSWSDSQVVATVATGSTSGAVQILQNGVLSNSLSFTVNVPHITGISPSAGSPGTTVTISGTGFGATQGSGSIELGSTSATVSSWSNTQIIAVVAASSQNGIAQATQNSVLSNAINFSVPNSGTATTVLLTPNLLNMVVGDTHTLQALNSSGTTLQGLTWGSSATTIASLSTDDPPIITALAPGHVTITAGDGSADLTIYSGATLPMGTVQWSSPGDGSGVSNIVPAVPSTTGVADVFAFLQSGNVQAIRSDGTVAWTASTSVLDKRLPDFQGGLIDVQTQTGTGFQNPIQQNAIQKFDGITGQPYPKYTYSNPNGLSSLAVSSAWFDYADPVPFPVAVHTDGTIFTVDGGVAHSDTGIVDPVFVTGIDPTTGAAKFQIPLELSTVNGLYPDCNSEHSTYSSAPIIGSLVIGGDGYAYLPYSYGEAIGSGIAGTCDTQLEEHLLVIRVGSDGSYTKISIGDWTENTSSVSVIINGSYWQTTFTANGSSPLLSLGSLITNGNTGVVLSWLAETDGYCAYTVYPGPGTLSTGCTATTKQSLLTTITNGSVSSGVALNIPGQTSPAQPVLQAQDNSLVATVSTESGNFVIDVDLSGNVKWSVAGNYQPQVATADGGVFAKSLDTGASITFDANGMATGQSANLTSQSWTGNAYQIGSIEQVVASTPIIPGSLWSWMGGNPSGTGTAARPWVFILVWSNDFSFTPSPKNGSPPGLTTDISNDAAAIKTAALAALRRAYFGFPVAVWEGTANTGDNRAIVLNHQTLSDNYECGITLDNSNHESQVDYINNMENAQDALRIVIPDAQTEAAALQNPALIQAIGRGIGNTAAHEIAHQFLHSCCDMDADPNNPSAFNPDPSQPDLYAEGAYNAGGCNGTSDPSSWLGYWPSPRAYLHWEPPAAIQGLQSCLNSGWRYLATFCSQGQ